MVISSHQLSRIATVPRSDQWLISRDLEFVDKNMSQDHTIEIGRETYHIYTAAKLAFKKENYPFAFALLLKTFEVDRTNDGALLLMHKIFKENLGDIEPKVNNEKALYCLNLVMNVE